MGRNAAGVKGISLNGIENDAVVGMVTIKPDDQEDSTILVVSEKGYGKRSLIEEYRLTNRGGKGVKTLQVTSKNGPVVAIKSVREPDDLMITTKQGIVIRISVSDVSIQGRATQGVRIIRLDEDEIADVTVIVDNGEEDEIMNESEGDQNHS